MSTSEDLRTLVVPVNGTQTPITPIIGEGGNRVPLGDGFAYRMPDGTVISGVFREALSAPDASPVIMPDAAPAGEQPRGRGAAQVDERPGSPEADLWNGRRTRFVIAKYQEFNPLVGTKGGFRCRTSGRA
ncbi:uncharacterized protein LOC144162741 [Haemaphysalis longicornis]